MVDYLKQSDADGFAAKLEEVLYHEFEFVSEQLAEFEMQEVNEKSISKYKNRCIT